MSLQNIIACEIAIWALRRLTYSCQSNSDTMIDIRRNFINEHNKLYTNYVEEQDFY